MLDTTPPVQVPATRFPPVPFVPQPAVSDADRRLIREVLARGPLRLPTDWPDLTPLLDAIDERAAAAEGPE